MRRAAALAVLLSSFGLTGLTYGFIRAGQDGWGSPAALAAIAAGAALLAVLVAWERQVSRRGTGQPLVELALFRSPGFTWGCILTTLVSFALFGILFAMPQYFQDVRGLNALGSGLRLLPMIGGMVAGMLAAARLQNTRQAREGTVDVSGLPTQAASAVRNGIAGGIAVARQAASTALLDTVRTAFVHALDVMLGVCGAIALASALLALAFLPRPTPTAAPPSDDTRFPAQITEQAGEPEHPST